VFALTALDCGNYSMPKCSEGAVQAEREKYVDFILSRQNVDGSFSFVSGGNGDVDITAMAVQALSNYVDTENVKNGIDKALNYISSIQTENGGFMSGGVETCESSAQVLVALGELGIDADTDARFIKNGKTVADSVMSFKNGTGFKHIYAENTVNQMSTEQAIYALSSYLRVKNGMNSLYDMSEEKSVDETKAEILEMAEKIKKAMAA
jgi:hypothetical protein